MSRKNISRWSFRYALLKIYTGFFHNFIFYKKIEVAGKENIPKNQALIFSSNHQNALMDPLAVIFNIKGQPVYLARSDIFGNSIIDSVLTLIKILPIYRIRDGAESLKKNDEVFDDTVRILKNKKYLAILPEGNHAGFRKLRIFKKGISRIVFKAEEATDFKLDIKVVPIGLDYDNYTAFRTKLFINFGKPIDVSQFFDLYKENANKGMNALKAELHDRISELMIDIQNDEYYDTYMHLREIYSNIYKNKFKEVKGNLHSKFVADKSMIKKLDDFNLSDAKGMEELSKKVVTYWKGVSDLKIENCLFEKKKIKLSNLFFRLIGMLLLLPFYLWGTIFNYIPYKIPVLATKKIKDLQFHSSFTYALHLFSFPIFYLIWILIFRSFTEILWVKFAFAALLPITGLFAFEYFNWFIKLKALWTFNYLQIKKDSRIRKLVELRKEIIEIMNKVTK
ncbi:MAG: 1-acyl-sn-glycerol-3-phosphate acyltransferase [Bacteroidota bacterium]|nr:1-acyl-sn-glycerol-3-phosphate acyltransferase [Bacteroidota bacterium]